MPQGEPRRQQRARDLQARAADEGGVVGPLRLLFVCFFKRGGAGEFEQSEEEERGRKASNGVSYRIRMESLQGSMVRISEPSESKACAPS